MKYLAIVSVVLLFASYFLFLIEPVWVALLLIWSITVAAIPTFPASVRFCLPLTGVAVLAAHTLGYKVVGAATVYDNSPVLSSPIEVIGFIPPNFVRTVDDERIALEELRFRDEITEIIFEDFASRIGRDDKPVLVERDDSPGGLSFQRRCDYWCGNTFSPMLLPKRLPRYAKSDFADALILRGLAEQTN